MFRISLKGQSCDAPPSYALEQTMELFSQSLLMYEVGVVDIPISQTLIAFSFFLRELFVPPSTILQYELKLLKNSFSPLLVRIC